MHQLLFAWIICIVSPPSHSPTQPPLFLSVLKWCITHKAQQYYKGMMIGGGEHFWFPFIDSKMAVGLGCRHRRLWCRDKLEIPALPPPPPPFQSQPPPPSPPVSLSLSYSLLWENINKITTRDHFTNGKTTTNNSNSNWMSYLWRRGEEEEEGGRKAGATHVERF